jgi:hypothetical protein
VGFGFKDVSQIKQILVGKVRDRGFGLGKAPYGVITLTGDPLHSCLEHVAFYYKRPGGGRGITSWSTEVIRLKCTLSVGEKGAPMENRSAFWQQIPKRQERTPLRYTA